jgi:hypothetical protein
VPDYRYIAKFLSRIVKSTPKKGLGGHRYENARGNHQDANKTKKHVLATSVVDPNPKESESFGWIRIRKKVRIRIRIQTLL